VAQSAKIEMQGGRRDSVSEVLPNTWCHAKALSWGTGSKWVSLSEQINNQQLVSIGSVKGSMETVKQEFLKKEIGTRSGG
jgi:hypothetical protein